MIERKNLKVVEHLCELDVFPQYLALLATRPSLCPTHFQLAVLKAVVDFSLIESWRVLPCAFERKTL